MAPSICSILKLFQKNISDNPSIALAIIKRHSTWRQLAEPLLGWCGLGDFFLFVLPLQVVKGIHYFSELLCLAFRGISGH